jgi:hypothetical protein
MSKIEIETEHLKIGIETLGIGIETPKIETGQRPQPQKSKTIIRGSKPKL